MTSLTLTPDFQLLLLTYNWAPDLGAALGRALIRLVQWQNARAHLIFCLLSQKLGLFHHYGQLDFPVRDEKVPAAQAPSSGSDSRGLGLRKYRLGSQRRGQTKGRGGAERESKEEATGRERRRSEDKGHAPIVGLHLFRSQTHSCCLRWMQRPSSGVQAPL